MTKLTIAIYHFFRKHRVIFYATLILSSFIFVYFGLKVNYEEDVTKLLPPSNNGDNSKELVFEDLKVKDKLFFVFSPTSDTVGPEHIIEVCDTLFDRLANNETFAAMVTDVLYKLDPSELTGSLPILYQCLPTFIDSTDYAMIDSLTTPEAIQQQMTNNVMTLSSLAGASFQELIGMDPLALRKLFINKVGEVRKGLGTNYEIVNGHFFAPDSAIAVAFVSPNFKTLDSKQSNKLIRVVEDEISALSQESPDVEVYIHGAAPQSVYNSRQIKSDLITTLSISLIIVCLVILLCYKNGSTLFQLLVPIVYGFFFSLTIIYLIKGQLSLLALGIGAIVLGVALSYCLHIVTHYKYVADPVRVLKDQTVPVILGCLTTIGAFTSLLFTQADLLKDFGLFASFAMIGTTLFCLIFLPQFLNEKKNKRSEKAFAILDKINSYPFERNTKLIACLVCISVICLFTSKWVKFDPNLTHISYYNPRVLESQRILAEHTTKEFSTVYFATTSENLDSALSYNQHLYEILESLQTLGEIHSYATNTQLFIPTNEQERRIQRWKNYWSEEKKQSVLKSMEAATAQFGLPMEFFTPFTNLLEQDFQPISLPDLHAIPSAIQSNMVEYTNGKYMLFTPVQMRIEDKKEVCDEITSHPHMVVIDPYYYTSDMISLIHKDFSTTVLISSIFVFIVLLLAYRSLILAGIAFVPMFLSWYIVQGIMGIFHIEFNLINIVISTFIFGIGVDYSIFVMDGLLSGYRTKKSLLVFHKTAILFSAFALITSVSSLLFAHHPGVKSIGTSTLIGMNSAVLIAYSLQPFIFYWAVKRPASRKRAPITLFNLMHGDLYFKGDNAMSNKQAIRNNYEYKGIEVERSLKKELENTSNYRLFNDIIPSIKKVLDYGCGYGFKTYWFGINKPGLTCIGFDTDDYALQIANNCYLKNEDIRFTSNAEIIDAEFDTVIINKKIATADDKLMDALAKTHYLIVDKQVAHTAASDYIKQNFIEQGNDCQFILYRAKLFFK